jgi:hypothetical protein
LRLLASHYQNNHKIGYKNINNSIMKTSITTLTKSLLAALVLSASIFSTAVSAEEKQHFKCTAAKKFYIVEVI